MTDETTIDGIIIAMPLLERRTMRMSLHWTNGSLLFQELLSSQMWKSVFQLLQVENRYYAEIY